MDNAPVRTSAEPLRALLEVLRTRGPLTRADLGVAAGLSRSTVSVLLTDLRRRGLVADVPDLDRQPTGGRPAHLVTLEPAAGLAAGVDIGRRHVRVAVADLGHRVLAEHVERTEVDGRADATLDVAARMLDDLLMRLGASRTDVLGAGLGLPTPLDGEGRVGTSNILPGWVGRCPGHELAERLGVPVQADNDANLGALAEALWGAGRDREQVVYLKAATGIGAGIVHHGRLLRGASGTAGEIGHTTVSDSRELCRCGNRGCLELSAGGPALVARLGHGGVSVRDVPEIVTRAREGDAACLRVLDDVGDQVGLAVANLVNLLNPEVVVLGGELGLAGELVLTTLRTRVTRSTVPAAAACVSVVPGVLGDRAEVLGAVLLVLREPEPFGDRLLRRAAAPA